MGGDIPFDVYYYLCKGELQVGNYIFKLLLLHDMFIYKNIESITW
jgi:hypothetical protein